MPAVAAEERYAGCRVFAAPGDEPDTLAFSYDPGRPSDASRYQWSPYSGQLSWLGRTLSRLGNVVRLEEDWNGRGSRSIDDAVVAAAYGLVLNLALTTEDPLPVPFVCPISGGTLQLEWDCGGKHVEIEFIDEHRIAILKEDTSIPGEALEADEFPTTRVDRVKGLLDWLVLP